MRTLEQNLGEEYGRLQNVISEVKTRVSNAPHGQLRIARKRKGVEYYYKEEDVAKREKSSNGRYMKKDEYIEPQTVYVEPMIGDGSEM